MTTKKEFDKLTPICETCVNYVELKVMRPATLGESIGTVELEKCKFNLPSFLSGKVISCTTYEEKGE